MKRQIRKGVFETNSSSTHSICIAKNVELNIPDSLHLEYGEFGWGEDSLQSVEEKASYLFTALMQLEKKEYFNELLKTLARNDVDVTYEANSTASYGGYIDHGGELTEFLDDIFEDEKKLSNYLFSPLSFILTGNDNSDSDVSIDVDYEYDEYYKGN
jgi:hypothetical protein